MMNRKGRQERQVFSLRALRPLRLKKVNYR